MQRPKSTHTATFDAAEVRTKEVTGSSCPVRRGKKGTSTSRSSRRSGFCDHHDALVVGLAAPHQRRRNNWILRGTEASSSLGAPSRKKLVSCRKKSSWCTTILRTTNRLHGQHTGYFFTPSRSSCSSSSRLDLLFSTVLLFAVLVMLLFIDDRPVVLALQQTYGQRKKRGNLRGAYRYLDDQVNSKRATENSVVGSSVPPGDEQTGSNKNAQDDLSSSGSATTAADPPDKEILSDKLLELQASGESDHVEEELQQFETANQATSSGVGENTRPSSFASLREKRLLPGERAALSTTEVESPRVFSGGSASSSSSSRKLNQLRNQIAADQLDELSSTAASSGTSSAGDPRHASSSGTGEDAEVREQLQFVNDQRGKPLGPGRTGENGGAGTSSENAFSFVELAQPAQDRRATEPSTATGGENAVPEGTSSSDVEEDANEATRRKTRRKSEDLAPKAGAPARKHPRSPNRRTSSAMQVRQGASTSRNQHDEQDSTVSKADGDPSSMMQLRNLSEEKEEEILQRAAEGYWSDSPRNIEGAGATSSKSSSSAGSSSALQLAEQELKREYEDAAYQHEEHRQHHHQHAAARSKVQGKPKSKEKGDSKSKAKKKKKEKEGEPVEETPPSEAEADAAPEQKKEKTMKKKKTEETPPPEREVDAAPEQKEEKTRKEKKTETAPAGEAPGEGETAAPTTEAPITKAAGATSDEKAAATTGAPATGADKTEAAATSTGAAAAGADKTEAPTKDEGASATTDAPAPTTGDTPTTAAVTTTPATTTAEEDSDADDFTVPQQWLVTEAAVTTPRPSTTRLPQANEKAVQTAFEKDAEKLLEKIGLGVTPGNIGNLTDEFSAMHWANTNQNEFDDITFPSIIDRLKIVMEPPPNRPKEAVLEVLDNEKTQEQIKTVFRSFFPEDELTGKAAVLTSTTAPPTATTSATPFVPDGMANYEDATNEARKVDGAGGQAEQAALEAETNAAEKAAAKGKAAASSSA